MFTHIYPHYLLLIASCISEPLSRKIFTHPEEHLSEFPLERLY